MKNKRIFSFCSIGNPRAFRQTLDNQGGQVVIEAPFIDHHIYTQNDMETILDKANHNGVDLIVTTQKDAVKLASFEKFFKDRPLYYLKIEMCITKSQEQLLERIHHLLPR